MARKSKPKPHTQIPHSLRKADGRVRVDVYIPKETAALLEKLVKVHGTVKDAVIASLEARRIEFEKNVFE